MKPDKCAIHGYEPLPDNYYLICGECWHCFNTEEELLDCYNDMIEELWKYGKLTTPQLNCARVSSGDKVFVCPYCSHDL